MISVVCLFVFLVVLFVIMKFSRAVWLRYAAMFVLMALMIETFVLGYFFIQIGKGTCFFLIGQDKSLDMLIKLRLSYATYFCQGKKGFMNRVDDDLGYGLGKDKDTGMYQTNRQGFRADKEYSHFPDADHLRMVALGDSFVFCDGERNEDAWPAVLERTADGLEVLNFGVPGYGLGQSYLRYLKYARAYHPDIVFINYVRLTDRDKIDRQKIVGSDNLRMSHFYRVHFWIEDEVLKSRGMSPYDLFDEGFRKKYLFDEGQLLQEARVGFLKHATFLNTGIFVKESVLRRIAAHKRFESPAQDDDRIEYKILSDFLYTAKKDNSHVIFFYEADFDKLPQNIQDLFQANKSFVTYVNSKKALEEQITTHNAQGRNLHNDSHHYNPEGNRYYAQAVQKVLASRSWCREKECFRF